MLRFFRNIRQNLLTENRVSKYLLYAVGEILLVVIGILIALQLDNLNEAKKERIYEVKMLKEVKLALENDIIHFDNILNLLSKTDSAATDFISLAYQGYNIQDSLSIIMEYEKQWWRLRTGVNYRINYGPYEAIKSSGSDKISNDSLRSLLINFYDFEAPRFIEICRWQDRNFIRDLEKQNSFRHKPTIRKEEGKLIVIYTIPGDLFKRHEWIELNNDIRNKARWQRQTIKNYIPLMENLVKKISVEIEE